MINMIKTAEKPVVDNLMHAFRYLIDSLSYFSIILKRPPFLL